MIECVSYPNQNRNYCVFDENRIKKKKNLDTIKNTLQTPSSKEDVLESLCALNLMLDEGVDVTVVNNELYPILSNYNKKENPNIQTYLAGIYRKTKVPDAFGPLVVMLIQNAINPPQNCHFDPNEEIGGAILDYLA